MGKHKGARERKTPLKRSCCDAHKISQVSSDFCSSLHIGIVNGLFSIVSLVSFVLFLYSLYKYLFKYKQGSQGFMEYEYKKWYLMYLFVYLGTLQGFYHHGREFCFLVPQEQERFVLKSPLLHVVSIFHSTLFLL